MHHCNICRADSKEVEETRVRSNVRKFRAEQFGVWRCPSCLSIHASEEVDLAHYYRDYPFHHLSESKVDWMLRLMYGKQLSRLRDAGLTPNQSILDYGCGGGIYLNYLRSQGFENARGFDEYSENFADRAALDTRYDLVFTQDVLEHVPEPWDFLREIDKLVKPGGLIALGTPNAEAIDLTRPESGVHTLHQPYHRHIFSERMLLALGKDMGWELVHYYPTMYTNTLVPLVNQRFLTHYFKCFDDTVDLALEPIRVNSWKLYTLVTLFYALFGGYIAPKTDVMVIYRSKQLAALPK